MLQKILLGLLIIAIGIAAWQSYKVYQLERSLYKEKIVQANILAENDSVRLVAENQYAKLAKQYNELDETTSSKIEELTKIINRKDAEIQSLTSINGELSMNIDTIEATLDEESNVYFFERNTEEYYIAGTVSVDSVAPIAYIEIDNIRIPINIDVLFVRYTDDETAEVRVATNNNNIRINNIESYLKLPPRPMMELPNWGFMAGPMFGKSYGVAGGIRYKQITLMGLMLNDRWAIGPMWNF